MDDLDAVFATKKKKKDKKKGALRCVCPDGVGVEGGVGVWTVVCW